MGEKDDSNIFVVNQETGERISLGELPEFKYQSEPVAKVEEVIASEEGKVTRFKLVPVNEKVLRKIFGGSNNWRKRHGLPMYRTIHKRR